MHLNKATSLCLLLTLLLFYAAKADSFGQQIIIDESGVTPLMKAIRDGESGTAKKILKQNVAVNAKDDYGWTALFYAVVRNDKGMVKTLLEKGADPNIADQNQSSPLLLASNYGNSSVIELLLDKGANINHKDKNNDTSLLLAIRLKHNKIADILRKAGASEPSPDEINSDKHRNKDEMPAPLNSPSPVYTEEARQNKIVGDVKVRVLVGEDGIVKKIRILAGLPYGLTKQALYAAASLRFNPAMKEGKAVEKWARVDIGFSLR